MKASVIPLVLLLVVAVASGVHGVGTPHSLRSAVTFTPQLSSYKALGNNCYSTVVNMTIVSNSTVPQLVNIQSFSIVVVLQNQPIANSTDTSFFSPNNLVNVVTLFPPINGTPIPVLVLISFVGVCLPPNTNVATDIKLVYYDGSSFLVWNFTQASGSTYNWT